MKPTDTATKHLIENDNGGSALVFTTYEGKTFVRDDAGDVHGPMGRAEVVACVADLLEVSRAEAVALLLASRCLLTGIRWGDLLTLARSVFAESSLTLLDDGRVRISRAVRKAYVRDFVAAYGLEWVATTTHFEIWMPV